jgi:glycosyltransferase involved in cell wall biosynthesis
LTLLALGTVEPRKNLVAAARIAAELNALGIEARLDIVGRNGWGDDWSILEHAPHVRLLGYCSNEEIKALLENADILINTSHAEGLGLPLLEAQYAGILVAAPDRPVFREVLKDAGLLIDPGNPALAASTIARTITTRGWRDHFAELGRANLERWNTAAHADHGAVIELLTRMQSGGARVLGL